MPRILCAESKSINYLEYVKIKEGFMAFKYWSDIFFFICLASLKVECRTSYLKVPGSNPALILNILAIFLCFSQPLPPPSISFYSKTLRYKITHLSDGFHSILSFLHDSNDHRKCGVLYFILFYASIVSFFVLNQWTSNKETLKKINFKVQYTPA